MPEHLLLKINGTEAKPYVPDTRYRLTVAPSGDEHFLIKAECVLSIDNINFIHLNSLQFLFPD